MELELGLGLSNMSKKITPLKEMDLISYVNCEAKQQVCDDDNSTVSTHSSVVYDHDDDAEEKDQKKKRVFDDAFDVEVDSSDSSKTLSLLIWDDKDPNEQDKLPKRLCKSNSLTVPKNDGDGIVGWPPIKSYRKKVCQENGASRHHRRHPTVENGGGCGVSRSLYVKVQMEGCVITRKVDLTLYHSYESLSEIMLAMFGKGYDSIDNYKLTYQDREGDWLLAGDEQWSTFIHSVQRLKLLKKDS